MLPSIFGENLFDEFFDDYFTGHPAWNGRDPLYGKRAKNLMKTDVRETEDTYEVDIDLPGFKKDEITVDLKDGCLTVSAAKGLDKDEEDKRGRYIRQERYAGACSRSFYVGRRGTGPGDRQVRGRHPADLHAQGGQEGAAQALHHRHRMIGSGARGDRRPLFFPVSQF